MRYIKTYNESNSNEMVDTIKDICIELEDDGFSVEIKKSHDSGTTSLFIRRYSKGAINRIGQSNTLSFTFDEVGDVVKRIADYVGNKLRYIGALEVSGRYYSDTYTKVEKWTVLHSQSNQHRLDDLSVDWTSSDIYAVKFIISK